MHHTTLAPVSTGTSASSTTAGSPAPSRPRLSLVRDDVGASTAEYATVTGVGVGFAAVLFKFLTSSAGQQLISLIFRAIRALLPF
jgi:hypothetical protein